MNRSTFIRPVGRACSAASVCSLAFIPSVLFAQGDSDDEQEVFTLSPFEVNAASDEGYRATSTLAGTRIATDLKDIGSSISVLTEQLCHCLQ